MKVSVFFDGQNFYRSLQRYDESLRVDYDRLAAWITQAVGGPGAIFAGAHYYVGVSADAPPLVEGFLKGLELRPGYFVKRELRVRRSGRCPACSADYEYTTEKRVDTRLVADIIQYAAIGAFDAAVLVSGDDDFVPAVEAVNSLGKQVWVATWSAEELSKDLRVRCFGQIHLSEGIGAFRVERPRPFERAPTRMAPSPLARPPAHPRHPRHRARLLDLRSGALCPRRVALRREHRIEPDAIEGIECLVPAGEVPIVCEPRESKLRPRTPYDAQFSLAYSVAAALVDGRVGLDTYAKDRISDELTLGA